MEPARGYPVIIQGGMGVAVSSWKLAHAVALEGQLGVVSGTGLDLVLTRRLQQGDLDGKMREALSNFPFPEISERILGKYFIEGGKGPDSPFKSKALPAIKPTKEAIDLIVAGNFVEVFLAKQGHDGVVGINFLEKIQLPTLPSLFGAMLAGVDYVLMGAGIPRAIPGILDQLARLEPVKLKLDVTGAGDLEFFSHFDPQPYALSAKELKRPKFLAIVSSTILANTMAKRCTPPADGLVIEGPTAGGHNAPPRGQLNFDEQGEPIYGPKDEPDLEYIKGLGLPFWLAGSYGTRDGLKKALELGAQGIQVGTAFAFCRESGLDPAIKDCVIDQSRRRQVRISTDTQASPTGMPFKVVSLDGTLSEASVFDARERVCDLGYLRELYLRPDGEIGYRCPGEPVEDFERKGGDVVATVGRKCVCNGLSASVGIGQVRKGGLIEPALVTAGNEVTRVAEFLPEGESSYGVKDVLSLLLG